MTDLPAEIVYLFRHALVRDAAYDLQPPSDRAGLHGLALEIIEELCGGTPPAEDPPWLGRFIAHPSDKFALELADHAELAAEGLHGEPGLRMTERAARYMFRSAAIENSGYRLNSALTQFERLANLPGASNYLRARGHIGAGQTHYRFGKLPQASAHFDAAEACIEPGEDKFAEMLLKSCRVLVKSHSDNGPYVAETYEESAAFWASHDDPLREMASLVNLAIWHCEEGDVEVARKTLQDIIDKSEALNHLPGLEVAWGTRGMLNVDSGRFDEAEADLNRALKSARERQNSIGELHWATATAELHQQRGHYKQAEEAFLEVIKFATERDYDDRREFAEAKLGILLVEAGRLEDARPYWARGCGGIATRQNEYTLKSMLTGMNAALKTTGRPELGPNGELP